MVYLFVELKTLKIQSIGDKVVFAQLLSNEKKISKRKINMHFELHNLRNLLASIKKMKANLSNFLS